MHVLKKLTQLLLPIVTLKAPYLFIVFFISSLMALANLYLSVDQGAYIYSSYIATPFYLFWYLSLGTFLFLRTPDKPKKRYVLFLLSLCSITLGTLFVFFTANKAAQMYQPGNRYDFKLVQAYQFAQYMFLLSSLYIPYFLTIILRKNETGIAKMEWKTYVSFWIAIIGVWGFQPRVRKVLLNRESLETYGSAARNISIALVVIFFIFFFGMLYFKIYEVTQRNIQHLTAQFAPSPSPSSRRDSYLNPYKQDFLNSYLEDLTPEGKENLRTFFEPYNLDEKQQEVVLFLAVAWHGITTQVDESTMRYHSAWHEYTFDYPSDWKLFPGDPGRIGVIASETDWELHEEDEHNAYETDQVIADMFFHAYCQNSSLEPPFKWTNLDDFITKMKRQLLAIYRYPVTTGPEEVIFAHYPAQKYIMKATPIVIEYHFFENKDIGTVYSLDYRYHPEKGEKHLPTIHQIADSFNTGTVPCNEYDSKLTEVPLVEIIYDFYDYINESEEAEATQNDTIIE